MVSRPIFGLVWFAGGFISRQLMGLVDRPRQSSVRSATRPSSSSSPWQHVPEGASDAILGIAQAFRECSDERKVNVCIGAYRDAKGKPWILPSVQAAERQMQENGVDKENKEYLPIEGDAAFVNKALQFAYGAGVDLKCVAGVQTLSGTGACRVGGSFLARFAPILNKRGQKKQQILIPTPTWGNHWKIFDECGLSTAPYRYYDRSTNRLDLTGLLSDLQKAPNGSIILLHACAHNPTGCDPTMEQWEQIAKVMQEKKHIAFFDSAYQGFASGNSEQDAAALRYFAFETSVPVLLAQSFAKNFGLYGERCGTFSVLCQDAAERENVMSQLRLIIRPMYSSPPKHGSSIVRTILSDETLTAQYHGECALMAQRIQEMRTRLVQALHEAGSTHDWSHVSNQIGMFAFTGMSQATCDSLTADHAIYLTRDGRISLAGLNQDNIEYVAKAIHAVSDGKSITGGDE